MSDNYKFVGGLFLYSMPVFLIFSIWFDRIYWLDMTATSLVCLLAMVFYSRMRGESKEASKSEKEKPTFDQKTEELKRRKEAEIYNKTRE